MQVAINKVVNCDSKFDYYHNFFTIVNTLVNVSLVPREVDVLSMALANRNKTHIFSKQSRKIIRTKLNISYSQLSNIIGSLKKKGILYEDDIGQIIINSSFVPPSDEKQVIQIAIINHE